MSPRAQPAPDPIAVGQVWRHHSTGDWIVHRFSPAPRKIGVLPYPPPGQLMWVWPEYLRENFKLRDWPDEPHQSDWPSGMPKPPPYPADDENEETPHDH